MQVLTTVEYADEYMLTKPDASAWDELVQTMKEKWLTESSRQIYAIPGIEIPEFEESAPNDLQQACCEVVLGLLNSGNSSNPHMQNKKMGISSISFGKDSVSYCDNSTSSLGLDNAIFSDYAQSILNKYIRKAYRYV
jgi:hypothetical protein